MPRTSRGFSRSPRRRKAWDVGPGSVTGQSTLSSTTSVLASTGSAALADGLTLLRLRGYLSLFQTAASAASTGFSGAFGIGITTVQAFSDTGVGATPTPIDEQDWDGWIFWEAFSVKTITATLADGVNAQSSYLRLPIDTRAMRKLREDDVIYSVIQVTESGTSTMEWATDSRILVALP